MEILRKKHKNEVVLIKLGVFYTAIGKDAVFLNKQLSLKCICFKNQVCKIGIPENSIEHYLRKLKTLNVAYVVYDFNSKLGSLTEKYRNTGSYHKEIEENRNCLVCKGVRGYEEDKYLKAIQKLLEEDISKNGKWCKENKWGTIKTNS